jgi:RNA polymerase sigma-70 factor (ECF subfamily)
MIEKIFHKHYSPLVNYCRIILRDEDLAQDVVQELFISLWQRNNFDDIKDLKTYLFKIAKNKCMDYFRRSKITDLYPEIKESPSLSTSTQDINEEDIEPLFTYCLSFLKQNDREVFLLNRIDGFTYKEISEIQQKSIKTIESQIGRSLKILREVSSKILSCIIWILIIAQQFKF